MAETGKSLISSMGSLKKLPFSLNDLHFLPAQVKIPLNLEEEVNIEVNILVPHQKSLLKFHLP